MIPLQSIIIYTTGIFNTGTVQNIDSKITIYGKKKYNAVKNQGSKCLKFN